MRKILAFATGDAGASHGAVPLGNATFFGALGALIICIALAELAGGFTWAAPACMVVGMWFVGRAIRAWMWWWGNRSFAAARAAFGAQLRTLLPEPFSYTTDDSILIAYHRGPFHVLTVVKDHDVSEALSDLRDGQPGIVVGADFSVMYGAPQVRRTTVAMKAEMQEDGSVTLSRNTQPLNYYREWKAERMARNHGMAEASEQELEHLCQMMAAARCR